MEPLAQPRKVAARPRPSFSRPVVKTIRETVTNREHHPTPIQPHTRQADLSVEIIWITPPGCKQLARISRNLPIVRSNCNRRLNFSQPHCSAQSTGRVAPEHPRCRPDQPRESNYSLERPQTESGQLSSRLRNSPPRTQSM